MSTPQRTRTCMIAALLSITSAISRAQVISMDASPYPDAQTQTRVRDALDTLTRDPANLPALEVLLAAEPTATQNIGTSALIFATDPLRKEAIARVTTFQPEDLLTAAISKGSDAAASWALHVTLWQFQNKTFDAPARDRLQAALLAALKTASVPVKVAAMPLIAQWTPERLPEFCREKDESVAAAAISQIANRHTATPETRTIVDAALPATPNPALFAACCTYWWLVRRDDPAPITDAEQTAFERWSTNPSPQIRQDVILAISAFAIPSNPRLLTLLQNLSNGPDESVRTTAQNALNGLTRTRK